MKVIKLSDVRILSRLDVGYSDRIVKYLKILDSMVVVTVLDLLISDMAYKNKIINVVKFAGLSTIEIQLEVMEVNALIFKFYDGAGFVYYRINQKLYEDLSSDVYQLVSSKIITSHY